MIAAPPMGRPASSGSAISSIRPMCRCCAPPIRCGARSRRGPGGRCSPSPASWRSALPASELVAGTLRSSRLHGLPHEVLDAPSLMKRFPAFRVPSDFVGVFQPDGGFVRAEPTVEALQALARDAGAELRSEERVLAVEPHREGRAGQDRAGRCPRRPRHRGGGAVAEVAPPAAAGSDPGHPPGAGLVRAGGGGRGCTVCARRAFRCSCCRTRTAFSTDFRPMASGVKVAKHSHAQHLDEAVDPDRYDRTVSAADEATIRARARRPSAGRQRPARRRQDLPLHHDAGRRFHPRPAAAMPGDHRRLAVLRPRLQVRTRDRRNPRRSRHRGRHGARHFAISRSPDSPETRPRSAP